EGSVVAAEDQLAVEVNQPERCGGVESIELACACSGFVPIALRQWSGLLNGGGPADRHVGDRGARVIGVKAVAEVRVVLGVVPGAEHQVDLRARQSLGWVALDVEGFEVGIERLHGEAVVDVEEEDVAAQTAFEASPVGEEDLLAPEGADRLFPN